MVTIEGNEWELFIGMNGAMQVYSFVAPSPRNDFSGDAKQFYNHLESEQGFPVDSQNMVGKSAAQSLPSFAPCIANGYIVFQFGTEPFTGGPATLTVSNFSVDF